MTPAEASERLVLIGGSIAPTPDGRCVAFWSERNVIGPSVSIPAMVDAIAFELRDEYVAWTHDVGTFAIDGQPVRAHLAFWPHFSFWWMGLIPEKAPLRTPGVYAVFKVAALERLYRERGCRGVLYIGADRALDRTLRNWCRLLGHPYSRVRARATRPSRRRLARRFPHVAQALAYAAMKYWRRCRPARTASSERSGSAPAQATIFTFFPNIDLERTRSGRFWSRYWEQLHVVLDELPLSITWVWLHVDSEQVSFREAIRLRDVCRAAGGTKHRYFLLDEFGTPRRVARALRTYAKCVRAAFRIRRAREAFHLRGSTLNFFPLLADDWHRSLTGVAAMDGALLVELLDEAAVRLGPSVWTLYTWENQPWEQAAIAAWRRHGNGRIIGVQHATLPPLDLRAFADPRELTTSERERRQVPDLLAVNGSGARELIERAGFPVDRIVTTEALRYSHLAGAATRRAGNLLLVVTGFRASEAEFQLKIVAAAAHADALHGYSRIWVKPHPFCAVDRILAGLGARFRPEIVTAPLATLWLAADAVFVANSTSAVAEALSLGIPAAVCAADDDLNLSPAFGVSGVPIVSSAGDLEAFLRAPTSARWPADFLMIDDRLPRWRRLLSA